MIFINILASLDLSDIGFTVADAIKMAVSSIADMFYAIDLLEVYIPVAILTAFFSAFVIRLVARFI